MRQTKYLTNRRIFTCLLAASLLATLPAFADNTPEVDPWALFGDAVPPVDPNAPDKSGYDLFNPTPDDRMRQFSTDRPGKTHSSTTVDAGHFQLESDFYNYTYDYNSSQQQTTRAYSIATPILKFGITNWADLEAAFALYNQLWITDRATGTTVKGTGFGDISLGGKFNLFGNDGGDQSLALQPFVKIPTAATNIGNGVVEYTLNVPYTIDLDTLWSVTAEPELGLLKDANDSGLHGDYAFIVNVNRPIIIKELTAALEFASDYSSDPNIGPRYTLDPSLQWLVMPALQLDMGVYIGMNKAAPDYQAYTGISFRI
jgi:Putative MetA-pathway of phenol degradation